MIFEISNFAMTLCIGLTACYSNQMRDDSRNTCRLYLRELTSKSFNNQHLDD
jgi:hypothetical protein